MRKSLVCLTLTASLSFAAIAQTGNVGIGTNTPSDKLTVTGGNIRITDLVDTPNASGLYFGQAASLQNIAGLSAQVGTPGFNLNNINLHSPGALFITSDVNNSNSGVSDGDIVFGEGNIWPGSTNYHENMRIVGASGFVGIGVDSPTAKVDVDSGNIELTQGYAVRWGADNTSERVFSASSLGYPGNNLYLESREYMVFIADRNNTSAGGTLGFVWGTNSSWEDGTPTELMRLTDAGNLGIGTDTPTFKLDVAGSIRCTNIQLANYAGGGNREIGVNNGGSIIIYPSDQRLKKDISDLNGGINKVMKLRPVYYSWKDQEEYGKQREVGFIAQEVKEVIPEVATSFNKDGEQYHSINYSRMVAVLTKAIQEQQVLIEAQSKRITELENKENATAALEERVKQMEQMLGIKAMEAGIKTAKK